MDDITIKVSSEGWYSVVVNDSFLVIADEMRQRKLEEALRRIDSYSTRMHDAEGG